MAVDRIMSGVTLRPATDAELAALASSTAPCSLTVPEGGIEAPETMAMLGELAARIRPAFDPSSWLVVAGSEIVGLISLVTPPAAGTITIGYGIAPARRGRGHATAAVRALCEWARRDARVAVIVAETGETNRPSQRVLAANGFACTGRRDDPDDGPLLCWSLTVG
jgi:RimJ/RimL family protein N-acetyltransferase